MKPHSSIVVKDGSKTRYRKNFKRCIGTGRAALTLRTDYMSLLKIVQEEIGFEYIRGHGLFHDELGVYRREIQVDARNQRTLEKPLYNWIYVKKIIDNYRSAGIKPFVELGFMPGQMASGQDAVFWWEGRISSPSDYAAWGHMIEQLAIFLIRHYGIEEVASWPFEVWNEPNCNFWSPAEGGLEEAYYRLYETAARALKKVDHRLLVGGPATNPGGYEWITRMIDHCASYDIPLDFISHHVYSSHNKEYSGEFIYMELMEPRQSLIQFERAAQLTKTSRRPDLPVHITEWNTSYSCIDPVHDTSLNAAYIAWLLTHADSLVDSYAYWVVSDVFEEADIPRAMFHGGFGLLTHNGIRKPAFHAFRFANQLFETVLHMDDHSFATRQDQDGSMAILLFNPDVSMLRQEEQPIAIQLPFRADRAVMVVESVDSIHGNAYEAWKQLGMPRIPSDREMEILERAQYPLQELQSLTVGQDHMLTIEFMLPPNSLKLVRIYPLAVEAEYYEGRREKEVL